MKFINYKYFHWLYFAKKKRPFFSLILSLFFWLFLSIAQPFGINSEGINGFLTLTFWLLPIGLIWIISIYFGDYILNSFTNGKNEENHKLDSYGWLLKLFLIVHLIFLFRSYSCSWKCFDLLEYLQLWFACILMLLIVYVPYSIYAKLQYYKIAFTNAETKLNEFEIELKTDGKKHLIINTHNTIYFKSDDNYIDMYIADNNELIKNTFRSTMKSLEFILEKHPQFIRVHRSYIVNLNYFNSFYDRTNQQIVLKSCGQEIPIPVSRKYKAELLKILK